MKKKLACRIWAAVLCACLFIQGEMIVLAEEGDQNTENDTSVTYDSAETVSANDLSEDQTAEEFSVDPASMYLEPMEDAKTALAGLVTEQQITALVYLCDIYEMKAEADPYSGTVCTLTSGDSVKILDVAEDSGRNIWFRVAYEQQYETLEGYVRRDYLAYSDERILEWESSYVTSVPRRQAPARARAVSYPDVEQFPESYRNALYQLKSSHPNWIFVKMNTGLDWNTVVSNESVYGRNLIYAKTALDSWMTGMYNKTWANASEGIIRYYLDPRNFLTESGIFQFEQLTYNPSYHTVNSIQSILTGTFMEGNVEGTNETYAGIFESVGKQTKVSPFLLASRVRQEQGVNGTSPLISGKYPGYEGYYNYYNIGASGKNEKEEIENGLKRAKAENWSSRTSSLLGGAKFLVQGYVFQGQDTLYLQKFDVDDRYNGMYWHQYMQNVQAPASEAQTTYQAYKKCGVAESAFVFKIPVYNNMPATACAKPAVKDEITLNTSEISGLPVSETVTLAAYINGKQDTGGVCSFTSSDQAIATVNAQGVVTAVAPGTVTISCTKENAGTASCKVTVIKADTREYTIPQLPEITYSPETKLENIALPQGWSWVNPQIVPTVEISGYSASYTPDSTKYNAITVTIPLTVKKADPTYTVPESLKGAHGAQLSSVALPNGFVWEDPGIVLGTLGSASYTASYNPDVFNYNDAAGIQISVQVVCEEHIFGEWTVTKEAGCLSAGEKERVCTVCKDKQTEAIEAKGHKMEDGVCTVCGYQESSSGDGSGSGGNPNPPDGSQGSGSQTPDDSQGSGSQTPDGGQGSGSQAPDGAQGSGSQTPDGGQGSGSQTPDGGQGSGSQTPDGGQGSGSQAPDGGQGSGSQAPDCSQGSGSQTPDGGQGSGGQTTGGSQSSGNQPNSGQTGNNGSANNAQSGTQKPEQSQPGTSQPSQPSQSQPGTSQPSQPAQSQPGTNQPSQSAQGQSGTSQPSQTAQSQPGADQSSQASQNQQGTTQQTQTTQKTTASGAGTKTSGKTSTSAEASDSQKAAAEEEVRQIALTETTLVPSEELSGILGKNTELKIQMADGIVWSVLGTQISYIPAEGIDMGIKLGENIIPEEILSRGAGEYDTFELSLAHEGEFGFTAALSLPVGAQYDGMFANLFYYNPNAGQLEFMEAVPVSEDGNAVFTFTHASDYAVIMADISLEGESGEERVQTTAPPADSMDDGEDGTGKKEALSFSGLEILVIAIIILAAVTGVIGILAIVFKKREEEEIIRPESGEMKFRKAAEPDELEWLE